MNSINLTTSKILLRTSTGWRFENGISTGISGAALPAYLGSTRYQAMGSNLTNGEQAAVTHFRNTQHRDTDGRYVFSLPRREPPLHLGKSREIALKWYLATRIHSRGISNGTPSTHMEMGHATLHEVLKSPEVVFCTVLLRIQLSPQNSGSFLTNLPGLLLATH